MRFPGALFFAVTVAVLVGCRQAQPPARAHYEPTEAERATWPRTVDEAATRILADMKGADKTRVRETKREDLIFFHHGWGTGIRNEFGCGKAIRICWQIATHNIRTMLRWLLSRQYGRDCRSHEDHT